MIDIQALKEQVDLLALAEQHTALKRVASSGGGEWAGACPFCGGTDRFRVQPHAPGGGRWLCRQCTDGKWQDVIDFGRRRWPGLPFREVCTLLTGGADLVEQREPPAPRSTPAYQAPVGDWQALARQAIEISAHSLWTEAGYQALEYLRSRGLEDKTIRYWRLGWWQGGEVTISRIFTSDHSPSDREKNIDEKSDHPLPKGEGRGEGKASSLYIPRGILIPCLAQNEVWYLKIALLPGERVRCQGCRKSVPARRPCPHCGTVNKYRGVKGNRPAAIFGVNELRGADLALFVEGEFDAMIAWQELRDVVAVCTLGSATNRPDLATWGAFLAPLEHILAAYDADEAGRKGLAALQTLSERVQPISLPPGEKDINDFVMHGGELWPWLRGHVQALGLAED